MGEVLLHPLCKQTAAEMRAALVHKLLGALDEAISAIEDSAPFACSPGLDGAASICRATRNDLGASYRKNCHVSPAYLDLLTTFMHQVEALLVMLRRYLLDRNALIRSIAGTTPSDAMQGITSWQSVRALSRRMINANPPATR